MALSRNFLKTLGIEPEKIDEVITAHSETVTALKEQIANLEQYKEDAEKLPKVEKERDDLQKKLDAMDTNEYEEKYNKEHEDFEAFKKQVEADKVNSNKDKAYRDLLREAGIPEKRFDAIMKVTDLSAFELDDEGKVKDTDKVSEGIKDTWSEFIVTEGKKGADVANPPANKGGTTMTKAEIMAIKDTTARHKAIAENPSLFGLESKA